ncbi:MAG: 30S ribosomal protein S2 [Candidatus Berkelbacteria bacterium]|nr:MAG: 30S ribosomal protein S2 [Candidatus Berkelbacteria bacterium]QQG51547.1 MAG: 30S ribosomal protein S2 [Candidatus Berkelbacteria bacterium]
MAMPTILELAQAGAHYGHHRSLTFPKAKNFIYMTKNNVSLINLEETLNRLEIAQKLLTEYRAEDRPILFVGTKRSIRSIVKEAAESIQAPYMVERWYGGFLTNFGNFSAQFKKMRELEEFIASEKGQKLDKKQRAKHQAKLDHYQRFLGGAASLKAMPELLIIGSATEDRIALGEARRLNIPVIAITDTDVNPDSVDYPIPANDDAPRAIEMVLKALVETPVKKVEAKSKVEGEPTKEKPKKAVKKAVKATAKPKKPVAKKSK